MTPTSRSCTRATSAPCRSCRPTGMVDNGIFRDLPHVPPRIVLQRGRTLARDGTFVGEPAGGHFVPGVT